FGLVVLVVPEPTRAAAAISAANPGGASLNAASLGAGDLNAASFGAGDLNAAFTGYGDSSGRWAGGDGSVSVELPDGRIAWFFSDTFVGTVNADHSLSSTARMVNNSIVLQQGTQL